MATPIDGKFWDAFVSIQRKELDRAFAEIYASRSKEWRALFNGGRHYEEEPVRWCASRAAVPSTGPKPKIEV